MVLSLFVISTTILDKKHIVVKYHIINIIFVTFLIIFAAFRNGNDPDYGNYLRNYYRDIRDSIEYSFALIIQLSKNIYNTHFTMFFIYALLSVTIRYIAIKRHANYFILSLAVYISTFYILHDMIQIRAAVAVAILLLSFSSIYKRKYLHFVGYMVVATFFHTSVITFIPIIFLSRQNFSKILWLSIYLIIVGLNLLRVNFGEYILNIFNFIGGFVVNERILFYITRSTANINEINIFSPYALLITLLAFVFILSADKIQSSYKYGYLLIKIQLIGTFFYLLQIPGISIRVSELYISVSSILLYPNIVSIFPARYALVGKFSVMLVALGIMTFYIFNQEYMR